MNKNSILGKIFSKQNLKKCLKSLLRFVGPLSILVSVTVILLSQELDLSFDTYEKEVRLLQNAAGICGFLIALMLYGLLDEAPKNSAWLSFCLGISILFIGMYFHVSIWIMLAIAIFMIFPLHLLCGGNFESLGFWLVCLAVFLGIAYGVCASLSSIAIEDAALREQQRQYKTNPDAYPKTVVKDIRKSEIYTEENGILPFSAKDQRGMEDIQEGDTVRLWVDDGEVKAVFYNSRTNKN